MRLILLVLSVLAFGCPKAPPPTTPARWTKIKAGTYAYRDLHVFVRAMKRDVELGLPGVAFGDSRGPRFGLLGGYYAPQIITADSDRTYTSEVEIEGDVLSIRLTAEATPPLALQVHAPTADRAKVVLRTSAILVPRADRTIIRGFFDGLPSFGEKVTAGDPPGRRTPRASTVEIEVAEGDTWRVDVACPRVRLMRPRPTGSTSVFVLGIGPEATLSDAVYAPTEPAPPPHKDFAACPATATSTFTFAWPTRER